MEIDDALHFDEREYGNADLPANPAAEMVILGCVLLDNKNLSLICDALTVEDFFLSSHRTIFARMVDMDKRKLAIDLVTLSDEMFKASELAGVGGVAYLAQLTEGLYRNLSIAQYCEIVKEKSNLRKVMKTCEEAMNKCAGQESSVETGRWIVAEMKKIFGKRK